MNSIDAGIIDFVNQFARQSWAVDFTIVTISCNHLIKGGVPLAIIWWAWCRPGREQVQMQGRLITTLIGCFLAIATAKALTVILPFRNRPLHNDALEFTVPCTLNASILDGATSFPSDHAVMFFALATGMFCISRVTGVVALLYTTLVICFPRIYLGLHYTTDILGCNDGSALSTSLSSRNRLTKRQGRKPIEIIIPSFTGDSEAINGQT